MKKRIQNWTLIAAPVALVACLAVVGCGTDEDTIVEKPKTTQQTVPAPAQAPVAMPAPVEVTVNEPVAEPEPPRKVTYEEAAAAYDERDFDEATELFASYTERKPENPWGYYMLGLSAWKSSQPTRAIEAFETAIALDDKHVKSYVNLSRVLLDTARPVDALARIETALTLDPESADAYRVKGRALYQIGNRDHAVETYKRAIQIDNEDAWSMNNLALILIEDDRCEEALPALARAVELRDDVAIFRNNLGMALERTGHIRQAESVYAEAVARDAGYEKAAANLDRISLVRSDLGEETVDLAALAQSFVDEIAAVEGDADVAAASEPVIDLTTSDADSTLDQ